MSGQLTLQLEPGLSQRYRSLKDCVAVGIHSRGLVQVAGKIDRSPSHLSEALSGSDRRKFDVNELEAYMDATGDFTPIQYLIDKFMRDPAAMQLAALAKVSVLAQELAAQMAAAGIKTDARRGGRR
jgi:hypothetical protein